MEIENNHQECAVEVPLMVNTYDIDIAGHVNNIIYIRWLEDLRNALFAHICPLPELLSAGLYLVVVASDLKYKKLTKMFDKPIGKMHLHSQSHGLFVFKAEIRVNGYITFAATQKCVLMNLKTNRIYKGTLDDLGQV